MSPGRNLADGDGLGNSTSDNRLEETTTRTLIPEKSSSKTNVTNADDDTKTSSTSRINSADLDNENSCLLRATQTKNIGTSINRSERADSTATDDSGIAAEFDSSYQNVTDDDDDDDESVLGNSLGSNYDKKQTEGDAVKSDEADSCVASTSSTRLHLSSTEPEDSPSSSPRKTSCSSPRAAGASWSPRRGSATDIIAERRRKHSQGDISKRTAWFVERTESALVKSALVRKRTEELIRTGKKLRNEEL